MAKYERIAAALHEEIKDGTYPAGEKIPSETVLAHRFQVSSPTVRQALGRLQYNGVIEKRHGVGNFVRIRPQVRRVAMDRYRVDQQATQSIPQTSFTHDHGITWDKYRLEPKHTQSTADEELSALFELPTETALLRRYFVFWADNIPSQISINYLPWALVEGTPVADPNNEPWPGGTLNQAYTLGYPITRVEESVSSRMPTEEEADTLRIPAGIPVFAITRRLLSDRMVFEVCRDIIMPADRAVLDYAVDI